LVEIIVCEDGRDRPSSFLASGHAGWDEPGQDVVCAAVATILQSAWLGLSEVAHVDVAGSTRGNGRLELRWPESAREDAAARAIVETAVRSVERIAHQYPDHVRVIRSRDDG
jgi:uncharacterized protein YsxB (DUF464 family)